MAYININNYNFDSLYNEKETMNYNKKVKKMK